MKIADGFPLQSNPNCTLCNHPQRVAAASMKELGATTEEIATALHLDAADVEQHFHDCLPPLNDDPRSASDGDLSGLLRHASELYHSSVLMGNYVSASSALAVRLRTLNEIERRAEAKSERQELLLGADPTDPRTWPDELARFINSYIDGVLSRVDAEVNHE